MRERMRDVRDLRDLPPRTAASPLRKLNGPAGVVLGVITSVAGLALLAAGGWLLTQGERFPFWLPYVLMILGLSFQVDVYVGVLLVRAASRGPA
jgi:ABC-type transport system involved in cytochrome bd biosynthesis fused ATPase/permease subunit